MVTAQQARPQGPCDIYAAAGTPCVTAHSTVRSLSSRYRGPLYQVKRADGRLLDIGVTGGFADAAAQDRFCAGTLCYINRHKVYGVSIMPGMGFRNNNARDLPIDDEPAGIHAVVDGALLQRLLLQLRQCVVNLPSTAGLIPGAEIDVGGERRVVANVGTAATAPTRVFINVSTGPWLEFPGRQ